MPADVSASRDGQPQRFSDRSFPPYAHIPGVTPHPVRDPAGHSYRIHAPEAGPPDPDEWRSSGAYCWGVDLFNAGYYWEAHEAWESVWIAAGRRGRIADFLKALIKLAAAAVKLREGAPAGAKRHLRRAVELLDHVAGRPEIPHGRCLGIEIVPLRQGCDALLERPLPEPPPRDGKPYPVLTIRLAPQ